MSELYPTTTFTIEDIRQALTGPLPGVAGQKKMAPTPPTHKINRWNKPDDCREAGVALLLYPHATCSNTSELHLALIRRPQYPGVHSGQISFPGGRRENGETLKTTALRETAEEIGILPKTLEIVGELSPLYTPPSNFCIYPFVTFSTIRPTFQLDTREVAELIEAPLSLFFNPLICRKESWYFESYGERQIPFFDVFGHKVWGATAMMLSEFLALLRNKIK